MHIIKGTATIYYIPSKENIADLGTKPLPRNEHDYLMNKIMAEFIDIKPTTNVLHIETNY